MLSLEVCHGAEAGEQDRTQIENLFIDKGPTRRTKDVKGQDTDGGKRHVRREQKNIAAC